MSHSEPDGLESEKVLDHPRTLFSRLAFVCSVVNESPLLVAGWGNARHRSQSRTSHASASYPQVRVLFVKPPHAMPRTGDPKFSVMQPFPAGISEKDADPFLMCAWAASLFLCSRAKDCKSRGAGSRLSHVPAGDEFGPSVSSGVETHPAAWRSDGFSSLPEARVKERT